MLKHHCNHHGGYLSGHEVVRNKELDDVDPIDHSREPSNQPHYQRKHQIQSSSLSDRSMNNRSQRVIIPLFLITLVITSLLLYSSDDCDFCHGGFGFARFDPSSTSTAETGVDRLSLPIITTGITAEGGVNPKFDRRHPTLLISERQLSTSDDQPTVTDGSRGAGSGWSTRSVLVLLPAQFSG
ncbi:expressed protein [Phakopsora pachyrhizi]|uniref:Expressed protein n=1 Tax=Phakopsora pachyrhizi TaxID=170000 RepID=A0AAV0AYM8_PHAPC|nr:expressed protein [Phakopsora pachyrhizi]